LVAEKKRFCCPSEVTKMRRLDPEGVKELAISILEEVAETNPQRIVFLTLPWYPKTPFPNVVLHIQVCEKETPVRWRDIDGWMERLKISLNPSIKICQIPNSEKEYVSRVINTLKNLKSSTGLEISVCVRVLKKLSDHEEIVKLFDRYFLLKSPHKLTDEEKKCTWLDLCNEDGFFNPSIELYEVDKNEVLELLL
jgi:hypothetical protein